MSRQGWPGLRLDTHSLLWWLAGDLALPPAARRAIENPANEVHVSAASAWEVATKHRLAPPPEGLLLAWAESGGAFAIERRGRTVVLIERAPAPALDALRATLWATPVLY